MEWEYARAVGGVTLQILDRFKLCKSYDTRQIRMLFTNMPCVVTCWVCAIGSSALAEIITVPNVTPGSQYRLAFTTLGRDASSSDIEEYNAFINSKANQNPALTALNTTWKVIGSTTAVSARDNTGTIPDSSGIPIFRLDGVRIADNNADLWDGSIAIPLQVDQFGVSLGPGGPSVWTGTTVAGLPSIGHELGSPGPLVGVAANQVPYNWIQQYFENSNSGTLSLYGISGVLTAPVPEPSSLLLVGLGTSVLSFARRQRSNNS